MRRAGLSLLAVFTLLLLQLSFWMAPPVSGGVTSESPVPFRPGALLVRFRQATSRPTQLAAVRQAGASEGFELFADGPRRVTVPAGQELERLATLRAHPAVVYAEPDYVARAMWTPNDPQFAGGSQWGLERVKAAAAWERSKGDGITVAVVDTGVDLSHPDLAANLVAGYDFVNGSGSPADDNGHGTHVAGIIAAEGNNGIGGLGIAPRAKIMPVKALKSDGTGYYSDVIQAIEYAADHGARVINMSFGGSEDSRALRDAVDYAWGKGALLVAAAGNGNSNSPEYPAAFANVVAVAASDRSDRKASFSNYGTFVSLSAPGVSIFSTLPRTKVAAGYGYLSGTSMAAPFVSGVAALGFAAGACQSASNLAVRQSIQDAADSIDVLNPTYTGLLGYGRLDAEQALPVPVLAASVSQVHLMLEAGDRTAQQRTIAISTGSCTATWSASISGAPGWLTVSTGSGPSTTLTLTVTVGDLLAGEYASSVTVGYPVPNSPRLTIPVTLTVVPRLFQTSIPSMSKQAQ